MGNCDVWFSVDFGRGPVDIRCTQTGVHQQHRTEVFFRNEASPSDPIRHNVFLE